MMAICFLVCSLLPPALAGWIAPSSSFGRRHLIGEPIMRSTSSSDGSSFTTTTVFNSKGEIDANDNDYHSNHVTESFTSRYEMGSGKKNPNRDFDPNQGYDPDQLSELGEVASNRYDLGLGKNKPIGAEEEYITEAEEDDMWDGEWQKGADVTDAADNDLSSTTNFVKNRVNSKVGFRENEAVKHWIVPTPVEKPHLTNPEFGWGSEPPKKFDLSISEAAAAAVGATSVTQDPAETKTYIDNDSFSSSDGPDQSSDIPSLDPRSSRSTTSDVMPLEPVKQNKEKASASSRGKFVKKRKMVARDQASARLRGAIWDEEHFGNRDQNPSYAVESTAASSPFVTNSPSNIKEPKLFYLDIDMSIPSSVYNETYDAVWDLLQWEAHQEAQREPLLVSFLYSTILNHESLESSLAFLLANRLSSPMMISTQLQSFILEALKSSPGYRRAVRADMLAVRDRDPACTCLPDVFLYFKGFQALQSHRAAHCMWKHGKNILAHFLQSQVSQIFQIDIHPNATMGQGIMLDHGTGIVIGETAMVGNNCSILHHVTLGGSGKKGVDRHPKVQDGVLLGAGATVLGNVCLGEGCQVGAGTLVISDLPAHSVAVGVPAKIIGSFIDVTEQPSNEMNQIIGDNMKIATFESSGI